MTETARAEHHETHSAVVFLAGDLAYKVKKPVDLGFLDFTTVERRAEACREELRLNRRLAPDVYLSTATLVDDTTRAPVEHVLVMRRLPADATLSSKVERAEDVRTDVRNVARTLGAFHLDNPMDPAVAELVAEPVALQRLWDGCTRTIEASGQLTDVLVRDIADRAESFIAGRSELFAARIAGGFVRDGHGDLQAGDVYVLDDGVRLIDCLDFDERLRIADVAADVGFLAMDLERLGRPDLGRLLLAEHERVTGFVTPAPLQHLYIAYRAWVRCAVACIRAAQDGSTPDVYELAGIALAHLHQAGPTVVVVSGLPASGKSTLARRITEERPDWLLLRSDALRDAVRPAGSQRYDTDSRAAVYDAMLRTAAEALALGTSVVLDATFTEPQWRDLVGVTAATARARLVVLECVAPLDVAVARLHARAEAGGDPSEITEAGLRALAAQHVPWPGALRVDIGDDATGGAVEKCVHALA